MIQHQIFPMGVHNETLLKAFASVPREIFVPKEHIDIAYADMPHTIAPQRCMFAPMVLARLLDATHLAPHHKVLIIGGGLGYTTALLSKLVKEVACLEEDPQLAQAARKSFGFLGDQHNIVIFQGPLYQGQAIHGPYDRIFIEGAAEEIPESLFEQLTDEGVLVGVLATSPSIGKALKIAKHGYKVSYLFETWCPVLHGFQKESTFAW
jgi:protein-L-isoaspartate(D-aspartate) O-methyltransferase